MRRGSWSVLLAAIAAGILLGWALPAAAATIEEMPDNSLLVGSDVYRLSDTESYTVANVQASRQRYRERHPGEPVPFYFRWKGCWFDLSENYEHPGELSAERALPAALLAPREYGLLYGGGAETEPIDPVRSRYGLILEPPALILEGVAAELGVGLETLRPGAAGCEGVQLHFIAETSTAEAEVTFSAADSAGRPFQAVNSGVWGSEAGFDLPVDGAAGARWQVNFSRAGRYRLTFRLVRLSDGGILAEGSVDLEVEAIRRSRYTVLCSGPEALLYGDSGSIRITARSDGTGNAGYNVLWEYALTGGEGRLEYREGESWRPLPLEGVLGPPGGLALAPREDAALELRFTPGGAGTYHVEAALRPAGDGSAVIAAGEASFRAGPRPLLITAHAREKTYGEADPELTYTAVGLIPGDGISGSPDRAGGEEAGAHAITRGTLTAGGNYAIEYTGADLVINRAALAVTAAGLEKSYGREYFFDGTEFTVSGLVRGDAVHAVSLASAGAAAGAPVGSYEITAGAAVGTGLGNYEIAYHRGMLTVVRAVPEVPLWPSASAIHGGDPLSASTLSGGLAGVPGSFAFSEPDHEPPPGICHAGVTFTPEDTLGYSPLSGVVPVTVNPARTLLLTAGSGYITVAANYGEVLPRGSAAAVITDSRDRFSLGEHLEARVSTPFPARMSSLSLTPHQAGEWVILSGYGSGTVAETTLTVEIRDRRHPAVVAGFTVVVSRSSQGVGPLTIGAVAVAGDTARQQAAASPPERLTWLPLLRSLVRSLLPSLQLRS